MRPYTLTEALTYGHGIERPFLCPEHGDSNPSASVNVVKKKWICYTCGAHGSLTGNALLVEPDYELLKRELSERLERGSATYRESWLARFDAGPVHPYWIERFDEGTARRFRLGYDAEQAAVTYPLRGATGQVLGVVRRSLERGSGPKYLYPKGVDVSRLLFGYDGRARHAVVLVEGALDAVALSMVGVHAFAIYGARLSAEQVRLIDRLDPWWVYTAFDADEAGWRAYRETRKAFRHRRVVRLSWPEVWGKDVAELSEKRRMYVVSRLHMRGHGCVECETCLPLQEMTSSTSSKTTSPLGNLRIKRMSA